MYVNEEYATSARILRGEDAVKWYNKNFGTNYVEEKCLSDLSKFTTSEPISVIENGSYYWFASNFNSNDLYVVTPYNRNVSVTTSCSGIRLLVFLDSKILIDESSGDGSVGKPYKLIKK